jgi:glucosamine kinase
VQTYLGIDAGGSGSRWALLDADGSFRSCGDDGPSIQVAEVGATVAAGRVAELLQVVTAREELPVETPVVVGLAGVGAEDARRDLERLLNTSDSRVRVVEDTVTGAAAALVDGPGVAVYAGTGSFAVARDAEGRLHRVGGRGSIASDHGSAYGVVRSATDAALLAADGMGPATVLESVMPEALGVATIELTGLALKRSSTQAIAQCFPVVVRAADAGDLPALAVLREAAFGLARLARGAAARAKLDVASCTVTFGGGTMRATTYFTCAEESLRTEQFGGTIRPLPMRPEQGAAFLARALVCREAPLCGWLDG